MTNECPLCKRVFHEILTVNVVLALCGSSQIQTSLPTSVPIRDHKLDNDVIVENFSYAFGSFITSYVDRPNVNEYVQDGFLVDDDAPIEYETQLTQSSSLNLPTLVTTRDSVFPYSDDEDSDRSHRRRGPSVQQIEREEREAQSLAYRRARRRKRAMVLSDDEDSIEDDEPSGLSATSSVSIGSSVHSLTPSPRRLRCNMKSPILQISNRRSADCPTPPPSIVRPRGDVFADSGESVFTGSHSLFRDVMHRFMQSPPSNDSDKEGSSFRIVPESPQKERRSRVMSKTLLTLRLSHLL